MPSEEKEAPWPTGAVVDIRLTGMLMPWANEQPVLLRAPGSDALYLPLFDDKDKLATFMAQAKLGYERIKQVTNGDEFLTELPKASPEGVPLHVITNPWFLPDGHTRWHQIQR